MKVYYTASARGKKQFEEGYQAIYDAIVSLGHTHIDDLLFEIDEDKFYEGEHEDQVNLYKKTISLIKKSDLVVLEVSLHSFSMGYVLDKALEYGKPVIALYNKDCEPYFALGIENERLQVIEYDSNNASRILKNALDYAQSQSDTRFNFFISPKHQNYMDWISKNRRIPRAVFLRRLIEREIDRDENYQNS